jgi:hypothetical protein
MKSSTTTQIKQILSRGLMSMLRAAAILSCIAASTVWAGGGKAGSPEVLPPQSHPYGQSYGEWSADWWQWFMEHPVSGHPAVDSPDFDVRSGQQGKVWFLASPFGTVERSVRIPTGKAIFIGMLNAEASDLEYGTLTEADQRATAAWFADHIASIACEVDGRAVENLGAYRVQSPQFSFTAPDPWVFSPAPSGAGTAVSDGYFVMLAPLSKGAHTIHFTGGFHFDAGELGPDPVDFGLDVTYHINVAPFGKDRD